MSVGAKVGGPGANVTGLSSVLSSIDFSLCGPMDYHDDWLIPEAKGERGALEITY